MPVLPLFRSPVLSALLTCLTALPAMAQDAERRDLLTFAQGALPVAIETGSADLKVKSNHAIAAIDGSAQGFVAMGKPALAGESVELTYALPALTQFDRFAIPNILETRSPSQTFFKTIEVLGSATSADGPFVSLAQGVLQTHDAKGQVTDLTLAPDQPEIRWVKLRLTDGILIERDKTFMEFSEIIGTGTQNVPQLVDGFGGVWSGRGVKLELAQDGVAVTGCYDSNATLTGTVQGNILRALGTNAAGIESQFILIAAEDGTLRGLRSTNGAPFKPYDGEPSNKAPKCLPPEPAVLGCGSVLHGIGFDYDSAVIRDESQSLIAALHDGLVQATGTIQIVGHSSSEGAEDYNRDLSQRRAQSVVAALVDLGIDAARLSSAGRGEDEPIASNADEAGRSLNRRVEVICSG